MNTTTGRASSDSTDLPVVVIGAGPVGLAAAAHLLERSLAPLILEAGDQVGASMLQWGHVRTFSPWRFNIDAAAVRLLEAAGWTAPDPSTLPTGQELVEQYLRPLAAHPSFAPHLRTGAAVTAVSRLGLDKVRTAGRDDLPFAVRIRHDDGRIEEILARAVIDASGTYARPNPVGAGGLPALGEEEAAAWIAPALPDVLGVDRQRFAGKTVLVVGMGHSAANTLLALGELADQEPDTQVHWAIRGDSAARLYGGGDADGLPARGRLGSDLEARVAGGRVTLHTGVRVREIRPLAATPEAGPVEVVASGSVGAEVTLVVDVVVRASGFRPDHSLGSELRLDLDYTLESAAALAPLIDPNEHSCGTVRPHGHRELAHPDSGYYIVGTKSYGRAPTFLLATGYEQVRSIAAALAGDLVGADNVELELPETGVCSVSLAIAPSGVAGAACCG